MITVGALVGFLFLHAAVIGYFVVGRRTEHRARHIAIPAVGGLIILIVLSQAAHPALIVGAAWLIVGAAILLIQGRNRISTEADSGS
ncbi:MAG: hypothetical protein LKI24_13915 [Acidipropionibacterium sp.]|jgi:zinc transporter ZupT|nr:hypothetical protein [Acidipropionibacterium sp.]